MRETSADAPLRAPLREGDRDDRTAHSTESTENAVSTMLRAFEVVWSREFAFDAAQFERESESALRRVQTVQRHLLACHPVVFEAFLAPSEDLLASTTTEAPTHTQAEAHTEGERERTGEEAAAGAAEAEKVQEKSERDKDSLHTLSSSAPSASASSSAAANTQTPSALSFVRKRELQWQLLLDQAMLIDEMEFDTLDDYTQEELVLYHALHAQTNLLLQLSLAEQSLRVRNAFVLFHAAWELYMRTLRERSAVSASASHTDTDTRTRTQRESDQRSLSLLLAQIPGLQRAQSLCTEALSLFTAVCAVCDRLQDECMRMNDGVLRQLSLSHSLDATVTQSLALSISLSRELSRERASSACAYGCVCGPGSACVCVRGRERDRERETDPAVLLGLRKGPESGVVKERTGVEGEGRGVERARTNLAPATATARDREREREEYVEDELGGDVEGEMEGELDDEEGDVADEAVDEGEIDEDEDEDLRPFYYEYVDLVKCFVDLSRHTDALSSLLDDMTRLFSLALHALLSQNNQAQTEEPVHSHAVSVLTQSEAVQRWLAFLCKFTTDSTTYSTTMLPPAASESTVNLPPGLAHLASNLPCSLSSNLALNLAARTGCSNNNNGRVNGEGSRSVDVCASLSVSLAQALIQSSVCVIALGDCCVASRPLCVERVRCVVDMLAERDALSPPVARALSTALAASQNTAQTQSQSASHPSLSSVSAQLCVSVDALSVRLKNVRIATDNMNIFLADRVASDCYDIAANRCLSGQRESGALYRAAGLCHERAFAAEKSRGRERERERERVSASVMCERERERERERQRETQRQRERSRARGESALCDVDTCTHTEREREAEREKDVLLRRVALYNRKAALVWECAARAMEEREREKESDPHARYTHTHTQRVVCEFSHAAREIERAVCMLYEALSVLSETHTDNHTNTKALTHSDTQTQREREHDCERVMLERERACLLCVCRSLCARAQYALGEHLFLSAVERKQEERGGASHSHRNRQQRASERETCGSSFSHTHTHTERALARHRESVRHWRELLHLLLSLGAHDREVLALRSLSPTLLRVSRETSGALLLQPLPEAWLRDVTHTHISNVSYTQHSAHTQLLLWGIDGERDRDAPWTPSFAPSQIPRPSNPKDVQISRSLESQVWESVARRQRESAATTEGVLVFLLALRALCVHLSACGQGQVEARESVCDTKERDAHSHTSLAGRYAMYERAAVFCERGIACVRTSVRIGDAPRESACEEVLRARVFAHVAIGYVQLARITARIETLQTPPVPAGATGSTGGTATASLAHTHALSPSLSVCRGESLSLCRRALPCLASSLSSLHLALFRLEHNTHQSGEMAIALAREQSQLGRSLLLILPRLSQIKASGNLEKLDFWSFEEALKACEEVRDCLERENDELALLYLRLARTLHAVGRTKNRLLTMKKSSFHKLAVTFYEKALFSCQTAISYALSASAESDVSAEACERTESEASAVGGALCEWLCGGQLLAGHTARCLQRDMRWHMDIHHQALLKFQQAVSTAESALSLTQTHTQSLSQTHVDSQLPTQSLTETEREAKESDTHAHTLADNEECAHNTPAQGTQHAGASHARSACLHLVSQLHVLVGCVLVRAKECNDVLFRTDKSSAGRERAALVTERFVQVVSHCESAIRVAEELLSQAQAQAQENSADEGALCEGVVLLTQQRDLAKMHIRLVTNLCDEALSLAHTHAHTPTPSHTLTHAQNAPTQQLLSLCARVRDKALLCCGDAHTHCDLASQRLHLSFTSHNTTDDHNKLTNTAVTPTHITHRRDSVCTRSEDEVSSLIHTRTQCAALHTDLLAFLTEWRLVRERCESEATVTKRKSDEEETEKKEALCVSAVWAALQELERGAVLSAATHFVDALLHTPNPSEHNVEHAHAPSNAHKQSSTSLVYLSSIEELQQAMCVDVLLSLYTHAVSSYEEVELYRGLVSSENDCVSGTDTEREGERDSDSECVQDEVGRIVGAVATHFSQAACVFHSAFDSLRHALTHKLRVSSTQHRQSTGAHMMTHVCAQPLSELPRHVVCAIHSACEAGRCCVEAAVTCRGILTLIQQRSQHWEDSSAHTMSGAVCETAEEKNNLSLTQPSQNTQNESSMLCAEDAALLCCVEDYRQLSLYLARTADAAHAVSVFVSEPEADAETHRNVRVTRDGNVYVERDKEIPLSVLREKALPLYRLATQHIQHVLTLVSRQRHTAHATHEKAEENDKEIEFYRLLAQCAFNAAHAYHECVESVHLNAFVSSRDVQTSLLGCNSSSEDLATHASTPWQRELLCEAGRLFECALSVLSHNDVQMCSEEVRALIRSAEEVYQSGCSMTTEEEVDIYDVVGF